MCWPVLLLCLLWLSPALGAEPARPEELRAARVLDSALELAEKFTMRLGNYPAALECLRFHDKVLSQTGFAPEKRARLSAEQAIALMGSGRFAEAESYIAGFASGPTSDLLRALALAHSYRWEELARQLRDLKSPRQPQPSQRFLVASLSYRLDWFSQTPPTPEDTLRRYREALQLLESYPTSRSGNGSGWLLEQGFRFWEEALREQLQAEQGRPETRKALIEALFTGQERLHQLAQAHNTPASFDPEFSFAVLNSLLDTYEDFQVHGWWAEADQQIRGVEEILSDLDPAITRASASYQADVEKIGGLLQPIVGNLTFAGEPFRPELLKVSLRAGGLAGLSARRYRLQLRGLWRSSAGRLDRRLNQQAQGWLEGAAREQLQLGAVYLGVNDVGFDEVELGLRQRPPGWQESCLRRLQGLEEQARRHGDRIALAQALALRGRLEIDSGRLERAELLARQALQQLPAVDPQVFASSSACLLSRERYRRVSQLLAEVQLRRGNPTGGLDTLERARQAAIQQSRLVHRAGSPLQSRRLLEQTALSSLSPRAASIAGLRDQIPQDLAVLSFLESEEKLYLLVLRRGRLRLRALPWPQTQRREQLRRLRATLVEEVEQGKFQADAPEWWRSDHGQRLRAQLRQAYDRLIGPVEADLKGVKTLAVIPSGNLSYVPFAALMPPAAADRAPRYLCQRLACVHLLSLSDVLKISRPARPRGQRWLGLGNPDGSLPGAECEVQSIAALFPEGRFFVGAEAGRDKLADCPGTLHIASHGRLSSTDPRASFLLLAGQGESARLRVPQIYDLKLPDTDLVVLSACHTAEGEVEPGQEITSLADAFSVAGSRAVLASLWSVADESTRQLMLAFYRRRGSENLARALQRAQCELLARPETSHPFFWAPFLLLGDYR